MSYTYPPAAPTVSGDAVTIHRLLQSPALIARRLRTLAEQRFISDALLTGRFPVVGGAIQFEQGESLYTNRAPEVVRPGMEYPLTDLGIAPTQIAEVQKWGTDAPVTDEAIKRLRISPVERAFLKLVNHMVKQVDSVALAVIASQVTAGAAAAATWATATAEQILTDVALARANVTARDEGFTPNTVVADDITHARAMAKFAAAGYLSRESNGDNPILTGEFPVILGMRWLATSNLPVAGQVLVVDTGQLGGMADENLGGPGYVGAVAGVETKSIRLEENDGYRLRARRVTVPVVLEPSAARKITGV